MYPHGYHIPESAYIKGHEIIGVQSFEQLVERIGFGYGHGYERFKTMMRLTQESKVNGETVMNADKVMKALEAVSQDYTGELTSMTQYSAVYNNKERKIEVCMHPDYSHKYSFKL